MKLVVLLFLLIPSLVLANPKTKDDAPSEEPTGEPDEGDDDTDKDSAPRTKDEAQETSPPEPEPAAEPEPEPEPAPEASPTAEPPPAPAPPPPPPKAGPPIPTFHPSAQERLRVEFTSDKNFTDPFAGVMNIGNRIRAGLKMNLGPVTAFAQVQDIRNWGSEVSATGGEGTLSDFSADNFDMHQGWGEVRTPFGLYLRVGRQEIGWHGQRLIGAPDWAHQARSFDAARVGWEGDRAGAEFFYALLLDRPAFEGDIAEPHQDLHLFAVRGGPRVSAFLQLDAVAVLRIDDLTPERMATVGLNAAGAVGPLEYSAEGYFQGGSRGIGSVAAFLIALNAGVTLDEPSGLFVGGGVDLISGDADPQDNVFGAFDTLYATNHKWYGHFDRYLNLPVHTAGQGLADGWFRLKVAPMGKVIVVNDLHVFGSMAPPDGVDGFNGVEWDVNAKVKVVRGFTVSAGVWTYFPGGWYPEGSTPEVGGYLMSDFQLK